MIRTVFVRERILTIVFRTVSGKCPQIILDIGIGFPEIVPATDGPGQQSATKALSGPLGRSLDIDGVLVQELRSTGIVRINMGNKCPLPLILVWVLPKLVVGFRWRGGSIHK